MKTYAQAIRNVFDFKGRMNRKDFIWYSVQNLVVGLGVLLPAFGATAYFRESIAGIFAVIGVLYLLAGFFVLLNVSVSIRRLRDAGINPVWILISFVPYVGFLAITVLCLLPSKELTKDNPITDLLSK